MPLKNTIKKPNSKYIKTKAVKMSTCHSDRPVYCRNLCKSCYYKWLKNNNPEFHERQKLNSRKWALENKEKKKLSNKKYKVKQDKETQKNRMLLSTYGITIIDYNFILEKQNNCCYICKKHKSKFKKDLAVDHNHITGEIRGLLCFRCNFGLSYFSENLETLQNAVEYLSKDDSLHKELYERVLIRDKETLAEKQRIVSILEKSETIYEYLPDDIKQDIINRYVHYESMERIGASYGHSRHFIITRLRDWGYLKCNGHKTVSTEKTINIRIKLFGDNKPKKLRNKKITDNITEKILIIYNKNQSIKEAYKKFYEYGSINKIKNIIERNKQ